MDYKKAINQIVSLRKERRLWADNLLNSCIEKNEELSALDKSIRLTKLKIAKNEPHDDLEKLTKQFKEKLSALGITEQMINPPPLCDLCGDTGLIKGKPCKCAIKLNIQDDEGGKLPYHTFSESKFEVFDLLRPKMEKLYRDMEVFCEKFPSTKKKNIIFIGSSGVGKSFLASCIAAQLSAKGESVLALSAFNLINERMLTYHTTANENKASILSPILDCSMLIIDDLGTESIFKNVTLEYLYSIINERMNKNQHILITTNLTMNELEQRYGNRITSRLFNKELCYCVSLIGKDVRKI